MTRLGVFGGTFDPPHLAHLVLAAEAVAQFELDRVLWVLTPDPPHKQGISIVPLEHRLAMVHIAIADTVAFQLSRVDIDRPPPHYAVDTLHLLARQYPNAELFYLIGGDSLRDLPSWHRPGDLLAACSALGVMRRPDARLDLSALEASLPGLRTKLRWLDAPALEISSSDIRQRIASGRPFRYYLHPGVYELIRLQRLYGYRG